MKYVLLGNIAPGWATKQSERSTQALAKCEQLSIKIESLYYTQGPYDFVAICDAADAEAGLAMSMWYADKGYGRIQTMPAFDSQTMERAAGKL